MKKGFLFFRTNLTILFGAALMAIGITMFYLPNKIVGGGVSGIATVAYHVSGISPGITLGAINVLLFLFGGIFLGKKFIFSTLWGTMCLSVLVELFSHLPVLTNDLLLASVFGGVLYGLGGAITFSQGASTGGTDILGRLIQHRFSHVSISSLLFLVDGIVILSSLIIFRQIDLALYGILALFVSTMTIRVFINLLNISKIALIITTEGEKISKLIVHTSPRGCTKLAAKGSYTDAEKELLLCALKTSEVPAFLDKVKSVDSHAFVIFLEAKQIIGNGFFVYH